MNAFVQTLNAAGRAFVDFAVPMLIQSSLLILILLAVDTLLRKKVRAVFRYWIWMLVLVKLVLPPSLWSPVSLGTWFGDKLDVPATALFEPELPPFTDLPPGVTSLRSPPEHLFVEPPVPVTAPPSSTIPANAGIRAAAGSGAAPVVRSSAVSLTWQGLTLSIWGAVVVALLLLLTQRAFFVQGLVAQAEKADRTMLGELDQCRQRLGLQRQIGLCLSPNAMTPAVCGLRHPVILIPHDLAARLRGADLQAVLFHELAHIQRGDLWINLLQTLLQTVYFYNPLLWLANAVIRRIREKAVDETVLVAMGEAAPQYPDTLINVARLALTRRPALSLRLIGVVESTSALTSRIRHILNRPLPKSTRLGLLGALAVLGVATVLLPMAKAKPVAPDAQEPTAPTEEQQRIGDEHSAPSPFAAALPNGVTVELLGACGYPSEGKQWWRPDGSPLAQAPYDRRGAWVFPNDWDKAHFELALRVCNLPENWEAKVCSPGNAFSNAGDPPYKTSRRLHDLRWLMMEADPNQTTCTIRCYVAVPWQTIARTSVPIASSQETLGDGVVFSEIRAGFAGGRVAVSGRDSSGEGVSIIVTGRVDGRDGNWLFGRDGLQRVVVTTKDGKTQKSSSDGLYLSAGAGRATAYFPRLALVNIKELQFQTRPLTSVDFKNVPLRRGLKTDVTVDVRSADTGVGAASSSGTNREKEIVLPEVDRQPAVLDLAAGELVPLPPVGPEPEKLQQALRKLGKGDLLYDCDQRDRTLILMRGATPDQAQGDTSEPSWKSYLIGPYLPGVTAVKTAEGWQYKVTILAADDKACTLKYSLISTDKGASGGALAAPGKDIGILGFRIVPTPEEVRSEVVEKYKQALTGGGRPPDGDFAWFEVRPGTTDAAYQITCEYDDKTYVLLWNDKSHVLLADGTWGLEDIREAPSEMGNRAIILTFDAKGVQLFHELGDANLRHGMAVVFEGRVIAIPFISTTLFGTDCPILGRFTPAEIQQMIAALKTRMPAPRQTQDILKRRMEDVRAGRIVMMPNGRHTTPVQITESMVLRGESIEGCILEVTADQPAILVNTKGQGQVAVENLTIRWQLAGDKKMELPAALLVKDTNALIQNCRFAPLGDVKRSPMAVYIDGHSKSTVDNCRSSGFDYVICYGPNTEGTVQDCIITDCGHQGVINYDGATLTVQRNIITGSKFHAVRCTGGTLHVKDNLLIQNANRGIYLGNKTARGTITNNLIISNGTGISGFGRADYIIANNVIMNNRYAGIDMRDSCRLSIRNNVLTKNQRGLALFKEGTENSNVVARNVFWSNATDVENLEKPADSVTADPQFADPNHGDFTMRGPVQEQGHGLTNPQVLKDLWQQYEQLQREPSTQADAAPQPPQTQAPSLSPTVLAWQRTDRYVPPDPNGFFPDDPAGGKKLDALYQAVDKDQRSDEEILSTVRQGFRRTTQDRALILRWIGNRYIGSKDPENPQAVEIMYHATPLERRDAVYFGLSVLRHKPANVLQTLAGVCVQYSEEVGGITGGLGSQRDALVPYLTPYLQDPDAAKREIAGVLVKHFKGELDFEKWQRDKRQEQIKAQLASQLPQLKQTFLTGDSDARYRALNALIPLMRDSGPMVLDDSLLPAMQAASTDPDRRVRNEVARTAGGRWIWWTPQQDPNAIALMLKLSSDSDRDVRYNAVYYGLSVVRDKSEPVVRRLVELALADHENNLYGRIVWGLRSFSKDMSDILGKVLSEQLGRAKADGHHAASIYGLYQDVLAKEPPADWQLAQVRQQYPDDLFVVPVSAREPFQPESTDALWSEVARALPAGITAERLPAWDTNVRQVCYAKIRGKEQAETVRNAVANHPRLRAGEIRPLSLSTQLYLQEKHGVAPPGT